MRRVRRLEHICRHAEDVKGILTQVCGWIAAWAIKYSSERESEEAVKTLSLRPSRMRSIPCSRILSPGAPTEKDVPTATKGCVAPVPPVVRCTARSAVGTSCGCSCARSTARQVAGLISRT